MGQGITYSEFVARVLACVKPLISDGDVVRCFCGSEVLVIPGFLGESPRRIQPSADSARLYGARAEAFSALAVATATVTGVGPLDYACGRSKTTGEAFLDVSIYARNIRRWASQGVLPRKKRARAELCLAATLWAYDWKLDTGEPPDAAHRVSRDGLMELCGDSLQETIPDRAPTPESLLAMLWAASRQSYKNSMGGDE